ncbi:MAG: HD domain-containing protein [Clostridia bacterium]|nr:HD domain-containing protein [Clostridia bacterium]
MIEAAIAYVKRLFQNNAGGHDAEHTLRVYRNALLIARQEPGCDLEIVSLAALLHDADDHKLFDTRNNANARSFLEEQNMPPDKVERIIAAINAVSFSQNRGKKPETLEGKIVQDADRLDAIGAVGIARTFAFGGEHGRSLDASIQHFYDKLLLLKDEMNTKSGRELAEDRHSFMVRFLEEYRKEMSE